MGTEKCYGVYADPTLLVTGALRTVLIGQLCAFLLVTQGFACLWVFLVPAKWMDGEE